MKTVRHPDYEAGDLVIAAVNIEDEYIVKAGTVGVVIRTAAFNNDYRVDFGEGCARFAYCMACELKPHFVNDSPLMKALR